MIPLNNCKISLIFLSGYTSFIKIPNSKSWLHCNNAAVLRANENKVNNTSSYIYKSHYFFFVIKHCRGAWISSL